MRLFRDRPFQFHLSTLMVAMLFMSALFFLNFRGVVEVEGEDRYGSFGTQYFGWPAPIYYRRVRCLPRIVPISPLRGSDTAFPALLVNLTAFGGIVYYSLRIWRAIAAKRTENQQA